MPQTLQINIKSAIFDRERLLTIHPAYIEFDDKELITSAPVMIAKSDIAAFRHGVQKMNGFIAGNMYCIDICDTEDTIIQIRLKSVYGVREGEMAEKYVAILNALYDNYFDALSHDYLKQYESGNAFSIMDIEFSQQGIWLDGQPALLPWKEIEVKVEFGYYAICSMAGTKTYSVIDSLTKWNAGILYSVLMQLLKYNQLLASRRTGRFVKPLI